MKLISILIFIVIASIFGSAIASQGNWCERWQDEVVVCQECRSFRGLLTIFNHNFTFSPYDNHYQEGTSITWNPYDEHEHGRMEEILFLVLDNNAPTPCPNFVERFDFEFCPGKNFNRTCPQNSRFWSYETKLFLFVASGTEYGIDSLTIWNATSLEWMETVFVGTLSTDLQLCSELPVSHPFLRPPANIDPVPTEPCSQPEPNSPGTNPNISPILEPPQNSPQSPTNPQKEPQATIEEPSCASCTPAESPVVKVNTPSPVPFSRKGRTGLIVGLSVGSIAIVLAVLGATVYFLPRQRAQFVPGPPQPHQFHENPIYERNTVEFVNPLYREP